MKASIVLLSLVLFISCKKSTTAPQPQTINQQPSSVPQPTKPDKAFIEMRNKILGTYTGTAREFYLKNDNGVIDSGTTFRNLTMEITALQNDYIQLAYSNNPDQPRVLQLTSLAYGEKNSKNSDVLIFDTSAKTIYSFYNSTIHYYNVNSSSYREIEAFWQKVE